MYKVTPDTLQTSGAPTGWLTIGQLVKETGITKATVHHYVQLGLLPPPRKTNSRMAYYDPACVQRIRLIKDLQERRYLPLREIKDLLSAAKTDSAWTGAPDDLEADLNAIDRVILEADRQGPVFSRTRLVELHGVDAALLARLEAIGLLTPDGDLFSEQDERIVACVVALQQAGLNPEAGFEPESLAMFVAACDRLIGEEFALFNARLLGKRSSAEVAAIARQAMTLSSRLLCALHYRRMIVRLGGAPDAPAVKQGRSGGQAN